MTDVLFLRTEMRASQAKLDAAVAQLHVLQRQLTTGNIGGGIHGDLPDNIKAALQQKIDDQTGVVNDAQATFSVSNAAYEAAVAADAMHPVDPAVPLVLLPVRIETAYLPGPTTGMDLVVRVYPDDIHVDTHEPELTTAELAGGTAYWRAVWGAGSNQVRLDAAWATILGRLKPQRAAWSVRALQPAVSRPAEETPADQLQPEPPLPTVATRVSTFTRAARTTLLPDHWRVIGLNNHGLEMFYAEGASIPDTLDLSFAPPEPGAPAINSAHADLPFHDGSRWLVDLDAAIAVGMAVRIPITGPDFSVGQLFVLGTSASVAPSEGAKRLESALLAHQYTDGLAFLPPGTPTNNTARTRSAWESEPTVPSPGEIEKARAGFDTGSFQNAAVVARALAVDGADVLSVAPEGLTDQQSAIEAVQEHLWKILGGKTLSWIYTTFDMQPDGVHGEWKQHIDFAFAEALEGHAAGWLRSRGTLPVMRVANQPYGLLPAMSLDNWVMPGGDPLSPLVPLLRMFRSYWLASVGPSLPVLAGKDPDATVIAVLNRLPVSVDIMVHAEADPFFFPGNPVTAADVAAAASIPGLPPNSVLALSVPSAVTPAPLPFHVVLNAPADREVLLARKKLFHDCIAVLEQKMTKEIFVATHADVPDGPPSDLFISLVADALNVDGNDALNSSHDEALFLVAGAEFFDPANAEDVLNVENKLPAAKAFVERFDALCALDPNLYEPSLRETLDVFSHRLDAWITSLAARRLDELRTAKPSGLVLGAYGWVENIAPRSAIPDQHYIHAPSMNHAATAAVLRAGYESHSESGPLAVNLTSRRVRNADWLAEGVRGGQTLGALLGYRFERGLHENGLDRLISTLRTKHPLPSPAAPEGAENEQASREAIAARNVVNGLDLSNSKKNVLAELVAAGVADHDLALTIAQTAVVSGLLDDLADVIDSFGDLLIAESVHHLVGGNPLRAGLTADTAGRGEPVPDRFDVTLTPRTGRPFTWHVGALLPADFRSAVSGWRTDRPRAVAEPHVNAWAASVLGNASSWLVSCVLTAADEGVRTVPVTLDALGICALDVVAESAGHPSVLELRIAETFSGSLPGTTRVSVARTPNPNGAPGFGELLSLTARMRAFFGKASPLSPQHLQSADTSAVAGIDVDDLDDRADALGKSLNAAVDTLQNARQTLDAAADDPTRFAAVRSLRSALIGVADQGVPAAWPVDGTASDASSVSALSAQADSLLIAVQSLARTLRPAAPAANAGVSQLTAWLAAITEYVHGITGAAIPLVPVYRLPGNSPFAVAFAPGAAPAGADPAAVMVWLRRLSRVRANTSALHAVLLATETLQAAPVRLTVAQLPADRDAQWAALPFTETKPPTAQLSLVFSTPAAIDPTAAFCGFVCDTWTEQLPGLTASSGERPRLPNTRGYEASEVTGMAFKLDTPDATAPQAVLLAIAPDPAQGWSLDVLFDTVRETLELAKIRTVDLGDLFRLGRVLPAIHTSGVVDQTLRDAAAQMPAGGNN